MIGYLHEERQTLEYEKNYDGYWMGELFIKQVFIFIGLSAMYHWTNFHIQLKDKLIPTFKAAHGPGYQAQFLIDNSQGHSTYGQDAPLVSCMNIWPGWLVHLRWHENYPANDILLKWHSKHKPTKRYQGPTCWVWIVARRLAYSTHGQIDLCKNEYLPQFWRN